MKILRHKTFCLGLGVFIAGMILGAFYSEQVVWYLLMAYGCVLMGRSYFYGRGPKSLFW